MKFRTEVQVPVSETALEIDDRVFSIGSCFSSEMSNLLKTGQIQTLNNPFGTTFNPYSINQAVKKLHDSQFYTTRMLNEHRAKENRARTVNNKPNF